MKKGNELGDTLWIVGEGSNIFVSKMCDFQGTEGDINTGENGRFGCHGGLLGDNKKCPGW
jgi:hypothetical protein